MEPALSPAPPSSNLSEHIPSDSALHDGFVYKTVITSSVVVRRKLILFRDKFVTYHNFEVDKSDKRVWDLNRKCKLDPKMFDEVREVEKIVRPPGVWTMSTVFGDATTEKVKLWMFTLTWPPSWAPQGYTSFTLGVQSKKEAQFWFSKFERAIDYLKDVKNRTSAVSGRSSSRDSETDLQLQASLPSIQAVSMPIHKHPAASDLQGDQGAAAPEVNLKVKARSFGDEPAAHFSALNTANDVAPLAAPVDASKTDSPKPESSQPELSKPESSKSEMSKPEIPKTRTGPSNVKFAPQTADKVMAASTELDSPTFHTPTARAASASTVAPSGERWVPYKHVNGVAIYYNTRRLGVGPGPEYMASCIVRGSPKACVDTLMSTDSNTTILGPASELHVIREGADRQVMRVRVTAPGFVGKFCAPRDLVVERLTKKEEEGIYAILFHSCHGNEYDQTQELPGGLSGWWRHPVLANVTGGYTIAPLEGRGDDSEECLVTCVLHVDLGGQCSERSWFWPVSEALGLKDAFVERMLMSVILIKDEIEHKRFVVQPFTLMLGDHSNEAVEMPKRSSTMIVRERRVGSMRRGASTLKQETLARLSNATYTAPHSPNGSSATTSPLNMAEPNDDEVFSDAPDDDLQADYPHTADMEDDAFMEGSADGLPTLDEKYWCEVHRPDTCYPFKVRGGNYLRDKVKVQAEEPVYELTSVDLVIVDQPTFHIARYLPSIRKNGAAFSFVCQLIIPGTPLLGLVVTFSTDMHPDSLGPPPDSSSSAAQGWRPFDYVMNRFLNAPDDERNGIFKLIPHIAEGSWVIRQSVGTTPVILGRKLKTKYHITERYVEVDVDISANSTAAYVVGMVKGATKSLVVDLAFVLEGQHKQELPELLLGAARFVKLDLSEAIKLDTSKEVDMQPVRRTSSSVTGMQN